MFQVFLKGKESTRIVGFLAKSFWNLSRREIEQKIIGKELEMDTYVTEEQNVLSYSMLQNKG
jgi:hypothetical protein